MGKQWTDNANENCLKNNPKNSRKKKTIFSKDLLDDNHEKSYGIMQRVQVFFQRDVIYRWSLAIIFFLGLWLRLAETIEWNSYNPDTASRLIGDEPGYVNMAQELLQGYGFTWPGRVPIYPIWLAGLYWLTGGSYSRVIYLQLLPGMLVIVLTVCLGNKLFGRPAGLLAGLMAAISYILIHQSLHFLSEVVYTPIVLMVTIALLHAIKQQTMRSFAWVGVLIGIANLIRPAMLLFPIFLIQLLGFRLGWHRGIRLGSVMSAVSFLVVTPWIIHNYIKYDAIFALQTSNAILWQGSPEYYHLIHDEGYTYMQIWTEVLYGPGWQERDPNSVSGERYWTVRALRSIAAEPLVYIKYATEKMYTFWVGDPNADWGDTTIFNYQALRQIGFLPSDAIQVMIARALPILSLGALIYLRRRWHHLWPLLPLLTYFTLLHSVTHAEVRLSEPLQPLLLVLVAGAVCKYVNLDGPVKSQVHPTKAHFAS